MVLDLRLVAVLVLRLAGRRVFFLGLLARSASACSLVSDFGSVSLGMRTKLRRPGPLT